MDAVLDFLATYPGPCTFAMMVSCGLGGPPWSEEVVLLAAGYFVAQGASGLGAAIAWSFAGVLAGDSVVYVLGRTVGERIYRWPVLRRKMGHKQRARFNRRFRRDGTKAIFVARFLPGFRIMAYFVAGNLGMRYWKFVLLDALGCVVMIPATVVLGQLFAENLNEAREVLHRYQLPVSILAGLLLVILLWRSGVIRKNRLAHLRRRRRERRERRSGGPDDGPPRG